MFHSGIVEFAVLGMMGYLLRTVESVNVTVGVLLPNRTVSPVIATCPTLMSVQTEAELALESVKNFIRASSNLSDPVNITISYHDTNCSDYDGPIAAMEIFYGKLVNILYGPCCKYALSPVGRYAKRWKLPIITPGGQVQTFSHKSIFPLLTRLTGPYEKISDFFKTHLIDSYGWKNITFLYHDNILESGTGSSPCMNLIETLREKLIPKNNESKHSDYALNPDYFDEKYLWKFDLKRILWQVKERSRIVVMCAAPDTIRKILLLAADLGFDNEEFVFYNIDLFGSDMKAPWYRRGNETENAKARIMYEYVLTVTLRQPDSDRFREFSAKVKLRAKEKYNETIENEASSFIGSFHDALVLYALALNDAIADGVNYTDGGNITKRMWNRTFEGITGNVSLDEAGDRNVDYSLLDMNETGHFEVVANYYGKEERYEAVPGRSIRWGRTRTNPPPNEPECGFDGQKCKTLEPYFIAVIVLVVMLVLVCCASLFVYRHYKLEAELAEENWRVRWEDIMFGAQEKRRLERSGSFVSLVRRASAQSFVSVDTIAYHLSNIGSKQIFTKTGSYKATLVAIKKINKVITVTKPLLMQIKKLRSIQNDHIVRFIGICIDSPNQCILTEYCQKGSLQDVLENEQIKLDSMFKFSMIQDIVRGVSHLHNGEIKSHGNIKSSNCVVDSRFVVKITDFGLPDLRAHDEISPDDNYVYYRAKLWTAPELLRMHSQPPEGTQKGDVYSFAIICQEIIYRNGPFWVQSNDLAPQEIYCLVKNGQRPYFRPTLLDSCDDEVCNDELASLLKRCWAEDPAERPDFSALKTAIKRINKDGDYGGNLLDNLLSRMEQYANNLEELVEARTADYLEQKKKAEDLLYMMLPRSVAIQLMQGQTAQPEKFECVTIYFSDICGFTAMSAESTPMQVVDLLNDLYTTFDNTIGLFDVYKVETIGDAYFIVSGLPVRNGTLHAREIARSAITLLNAVKSFKIRHRPYDKLKLRIGIHSGPVCAGIVGRKMPRYCLIGDTVNTASRMESTGEPLKIHVSWRTKELLDSFSTFVLELRGSVPMKGKGEMITWWLLGETNPEFPELSPPDSINYETDRPNNFKIF